jgi:hypothetical protein
VTAALLALALAAGVPAGSVRLRAELAGTAVGAVDLAVSCAGARCEVRYRSRLRLPAESGGGVADASVEVEVDRDGRYRGGALRVRRAGAAHAPRAPDGAVPASLAELVLAAEAPADGAEACVPFFDEERPLPPRRACARRERGGALAADVGGIAVRIVPGPDGFPDEVLVAGRFRYVRDAAAALPREPPRLAGTRIPGPGDPAAAQAFCGVPLDPAPDAARAAALPAPSAAGASCREKTAAWLAGARARGLDGRTAVGAAWDGRGFVWHAWAEVRVGHAWIPVDPSFGERPARGPRFTVARFGEHDAAARDAAGAAIFECWGTARVE